MPHLNRCFRWRDCAGGGAGILTARERGCDRRRESALLANTGTSSQSELLRVSLVVAHELAHQYMAERGAASARLAVTRAPRTQVEREPRDDRMVVYTLAQ